MIDILMEHEYSKPKLYEFISEVFDCSIDQIKIFSIDELNSVTDELDFSKFDCICVSSYVQGKASLLLQLYRYKIDDMDVCKRVVDIAYRRSMHCYIPSDSFNGWIYVGDDREPKQARQIDCDEDDCYLFKLI